MKNRYIAACLALLFIVGVSCRTSNQIEKNVDVLVVGGTTSGTSAGIASARNGVSTLIVEETPWLGGMFTAQGVGAVDGNHDLHSGIWNEFRDRLRTHYGGAGALHTGWVSRTLFEPHVGDSVFKAMAAAEKNLEIIYGYYITEILKEGSRVVGAVFSNDEGDKIVVKAKVVVDATDLGDCLPLSDTDYRLGMDSRTETGEFQAPEQANDIIQDLTWVAIMKDYGADADMTIPRPEGYNPENFKGCCVADGEEVEGKVDCIGMLSYGRMPKGKYMLNWPKVGNDVYLNVVEMSREERNKELEKARNYTLQYVYYIQHELGYKHLGLADDEYTTSDRLAYLPYHREGRRLKGVSLLTLNHVSEPYNSTLYRTGISVGDYPVDHHHAAYPDAPKIDFPPVPSFNIPLGALIPEKTDGLIVSDKAISVTNIINGSTRLQPVVLLTGQAAGTLAAMSVKENKQVREISVREVQTNLLGQGVYIMPLFDIANTDPDFAAIQRITATGILTTVGEPHDWDNRTWFYPDQNVSIAEFTSGLNSFTNTIKVSEDNKPITEQQALDFILQAGGDTQKAMGVTDKPATKRKLAQMLDALLNPFTKDVDFEGKYKE